MTTATDCTRCNGWGDIVTARDYQWHVLQLRCCEECGGTGKVEASPDEAQVRAAVGS
jgi:DnaJ-class molecular chaperone